MSSREIRAPDCLRLDPSPDPCSGELWRTLTNVWHGVRLPPIEVRMGVYHRTDKMSAVNPSVWREQQAGKSANLMSGPSTWRRRTIPGKFSLPEGNRQISITSAATTAERLDSQAKGINEDSG